MTVYSPSATMAFARCPQLWQFYREGWQPKHIGKVEIAAAYGVGYARAMETLFHSMPDPAPGDIEKAAFWGVEAAQRYIHTRIEAGGVVGSDGTSVGLISERLTKAVVTFAKRWICPRSWHSFMPELTFPEHGNCRVDLLCQTDFGPCIIDFKTKVTKPQAYALQKFVSDFEHSWQFYHYVWAARENGIHVTSFAVIVVSFEGFSITQEQWVVDEEYLEQWEHSAREWWQRMDEAKNNAVYPMAPDHSDKYGLCRYADVCLQGDRWNSERWERNLIHVPRD